jgi:hypothetical protein
MKNVKIILGRKQINKLDSHLAAIGYFLLSAYFCDRKRENLFTVASSAVEQLLQHPLRDT